MISDLVDISMGEKDISTFDEEEFLNLVEQVKGKDYESSPLQQQIDAMTEKLEQRIEQEIWYQLKSINPKIEISLAFGGKEFCHEGYYNCS